MTSMTFASRSLLQIVLVATLIAAFTFATSLANFRSVWNVLWMVGIPFAVSKAFDQDDGVWLLTGLWLLLCSIAAMVSTAALFGLGP